MPNDSDEGSVLLHVLVPATLAKKLDDYRFRWRFNSRAVVIRNALEEYLKDEDPSKGVYPEVD